MATLVYSDVDGVDRSFALGTEPVIVGRGPECAIRSRDPRVSRTHARFFLEHGTLWVEDLGSSNGIFIGPNKVQRAPVPTGEIMLIGSLVIRLLPLSGTLPPPVGLHGTLATWLDLERKTRATVEDERDAFAKRVGELHQEIATLKLPETLSPDVTVPGGFNAEAIRLRDEAEARAAALERALAAVQDELVMLREGGIGSRAQTRNEDTSPASEDPEDTLQMRGELGELRMKIRELEQDLAERAGRASNADHESSRLAQEILRLQASLDDAEAARSIAEHAHGEAMRESQALRDDLDKLRRNSAAELEIARLDISRSREAKLMAETAVGIATAEKLAEADVVINRLQREISALKTTAAEPEARVQVAVDQITTLTAKLEKLEKDLAAAQIRAQGAERNLSGATAQAAKAEAKAALLEHKIADAEARVKAGEHESAKTLERIHALETRLGAGDAPLQAAEARAAKISAELVELASQFETRRVRLVELEQQLAGAIAASNASDAQAAAVRAELATAEAELATAEANAAELAARLDQLGAASSAIAAANKLRDEAVAKLAAADKRIGAADRRVADAEQRASAADTMAKAMAKDVAEALRRAADTDNRVKTVHRELAEALRRAEQAEANIDAGASSIKELERRAAQAETRLQGIQAEADARVVAIQRELISKAEATRHELTAKLADTERELSSKLEAAQRKLAAERSTSHSIIDRKTSLERELAELRTQLARIEQRAAQAEQRADHAEEELADAESQIETLQERVTELEDVEVDEAQRQATETERRRAELSAKAEAADHAIGLAGALQRQLDEAISKLARHEREAASRDQDPPGAAQTEAMVAERLGSVELRIQEAEAQARDAEDRARESDIQIRQAEQEVARMSKLMIEADRRAQRAEEATRAASGNADADRRVQAAEQASKELERRLAEATAKLAEAISRLTSLQKEFDAAEHVRSFAAETEREIAQLQRDLRDARLKATQMTLERDRLESELKDAHSGDTDTTSRLVPITPSARPTYDPEATAPADLRKYESMIAQTSELQNQVRRLEREGAELRALLADAEQKLRDAIDRSDEDDSESTRTGAQLPIVLAEHVSMLEESIDSLRANMRAASDETAAMNQSKSVVTIASAVNQAQADVERARGAIKLLASAIGMKRNR